MVVQTFKILGFIVPEKTLIQTSLCLTFEWQMEKRKMEKEGKINPSILLFFYTIDFNPLYLYTKIESSSSRRSWEICDENFY